jgi:UDP-glucose 4-epimerase
VRDYIHVDDLAVAHVLAMENNRPGEHRIYNLGTGHGYSVRQVVDTARRVTGREIAAVEEARRPGDPPALVAAADRASAELGWQPEKTLEEMIADAWEWHQAHPRGYEQS